METAEGEAALLGSQEGEWMTGEETRDCSVKWGDREPLSVPEAVERLRSAGAPMSGDHLLKERSGPCAYDGDRMRLNVWRAAGMEGEWLPSVDEERGEDENDDEEEEDDEEDEDEEDEDEDEDDKDGDWIFKGDGEEDRRFNEDEGNAVVVVDDGDDDEEEDDNDD